MECACTKPGDARAQKGRQGNGIAGAEGSAPYRDEVCHPLRLRPNHNPSPAEVERRDHNLVGEQRADVLHRRRVEEGHRGALLEDRLLEGNDPRVVGVAAGALAGAAGVEGNLLAISVVQRNVSVRFQTTQSVSTDSTRAETSVGPYRSTPAWVVRKTPSRSCCCAVSRPKEGITTCQLILWLASGVSNEGPRSRVLVLVPAVSWPWVPAWGLSEPSRRGGENAQKTGKNGGKMGKIQPKKCGRSGA